MSELKEPVKDTQKVVPPPLYAVMLHNDDFTPFDFVVSVLCGVCNLSEETAFQVAKDVHQKGKAAAGIYPRDIAETRRLQISLHAEQKQHPLLADIEPAL